MTNSLGEAIYRYYNKPSYNVYSYPKSVETLRLGSPNRSKTVSVVPASPSEPEARRQQDANIDQNRDQSIHLLSPQPLLVSSPTNATQIANSDSPEPEALQEDPEVNNDDIEKEYSTAEEPRKFKDTLLVSVATQEKADDEDDPDTPAHEKDSVSSEADSDYTDDMAEEALQSPSMGDYSSSSSSSDDERNAVEAEPESAFEKVKPDDAWTPKTLVLIENKPRPVEESIVEKQAYSPMDEKELLAASEKSEKSENGKSEPMSNPTDVASLEIPGAKIIENTDPGSCDKASERNDSEEHLSQEEEENGFASKKIEVVKTPTIMAVDAVRLKATPQNAKAQEPPEVEKQPEEEGVESSTSEESDNSSVQSSIYEEESVSGVAQSESPSFVEICQEEMPERSNDDGQPDSHDSEQQEEEVDEEEDSDDLLDEQSDAPQRSTEDEQTDDEDVEEEDSSELTEEQSEESSGQENSTEEHTDSEAVEVTQSELPMVVEIDTIRHEASLSENEGVDQQEEEEEGEEEEESCDSSDEQSNVPQRSQEEEQADCGEVDQQEKEKDTHELVVQQSYGPSAESYDSDEGAATRGVEVIQSELPNTMEVHTSLEESPLQQTKELEPTLTRIVHGAGIKSSFLTPPSSKPTSPVFVSPEESSFSTPAKDSLKKRKEPLTPAEFFSLFPTPKKARHVTPAEFFRTFPLPAFLERKTDFQARQKRVRRRLANEGGY